MHDIFLWVVGTLGAVILMFVVLIIILEASYFGRP